ncbi:MAG: hypothetical protein HOM59_01520, partial [Candidatus Marinimicrobia bacterium]|nr:hypothetical protein [Candidatus Neomarinimicrobiota bacterium]
MIDPPNAAPITIHNRRISGGRPSSQFKKLLMRSRPMIKTMNADKNESQPMVKKKEGIFESSAERINAAPKMSLEITADGTIQFFSPIDLTVLIKVKGEKRLKTQTVQIAI